MASNQVTLLSLNSRREAPKHQYYKGFKNVVYLAGYVYEIKANMIYLQMTNNINLLLPVTVPPGVKMPNNFRRREAIKMVCQVRSHKDEAGVTGVRIYARSFERPNILELPLRSAFDKKVPARATEDRDFKPYGSGYRQTDACNQTHIAGMVVGVNQRTMMLSEEGEYSQSPAVDFLLRQDDDETNVIPVRYYGKLAEQIASRVRLGDLIYTTGKYRVRPIEKGVPSDGKPVEVMPEPYIHIDPPQQPSEFEILYLAENQQFPKWMIDLHAKFKLGQQRRVPKKAEVVAPDGGHQAANSSAADYEAHPKWATLSEGDKEAARENEAVRNLLLGT